MNEPKEVWIGLAEVTIGENCDLDLEGAGSFTWCATQAWDKENFSKKIEGMLVFYGLHLVDLREYVDSMILKIHLDGRNAGRLQRTRISPSTELPHVSAPYSMKGSNSRCSTHS